MRWRIDALTTASFVFTVSSTNPVLCTTFGRERGSEHVDDARPRDRGGASLGTSKKSASETRRRDASTAPESATAPSTRSDAGEIGVEVGRLRLILTGQREPELGGDSRTRATQLRRDCGTNDVRAVNEGPRRRTTTTTTTTHSTHHASDEHSVAPEDLEDLRDARLGPCVVVKHPRIGRGRGRGLRTRRVQKNGAARCVGRRSSRRPRIPRSRRGRSGAHMATKRAYTRTRRGSSGAAT